ncbi:UNVERIFIED_CONTAM: hypothetical protein K2H54_041449 [Gekko kuhli]
MPGLPARSPPGARRLQGTWRRSGREARDLNLPSNLSTKVERLREKPRLLFLLQCQFQSLSTNLKILDVAAVDLTLQGEDTSWLGCKRHIIKKLVIFQTFEQPTVMSAAEDELLAPVEVTSAAEDELPALADPTPDPNEAV